MDFNRIKPLASKPPRLAFSCTKKCLLMVSHGQNKMKHYNTAWAIFRPTVSW